MAMRRIIRRGCCEARRGIGWTARGEPRMARIDEGFLGRLPPTGLPGDWQSQRAQRRGALPHTPAGANSPCTRN